MTFEEMIEAANSPVGELKMPETGVDFSATESIPICDYCLKAVPVSSKIISDGITDAHRNICDHCIEMVTQNNFTVKS